MTTSDSNKSAKEGRIETHGKGLGLPTQENIERRARELDQIEGHEGDEISDESRRRALSEFNDAAIRLSSDESRSHVLASSNPANIAVDLGKAVENATPPDEQQIEELEVKEGVREAEHERMLEGQKMEQEDDK